MNNIFVHAEDIVFKLTNKEKVLSWINHTISSNNKTCKQVNYIFCTDKYLLHINQHYLNHDFYTDIITFNNSDNPDEIEGDIYISLDRIKENSTSLNVKFKDELHRVMIHGVLHLIGINDKTEAEKIEMRKIEDHYLALREF